MQTVLQKDPFSGHAFIFRGKRGDLFKYLYWCDGGMCLAECACLPSGWNEVGVPGRAEGGVVALTNAQLELLLKGFDWRQPIETVLHSS